MWLAAGALTLSAAACGSSSKTDTASAGSGAAPTDATASSTAPTDASTADGASAHAGSIDVCALLTPAGASAAAKEVNLGNDPAATYKLIAEKQPPVTTSYPTSACKFTIATVTADNTGSEVTLVVTVQPAKYLDKTGTKIDGLGDEAYDEGPYAQVRVGDIILQSNENSGTENFALAIYKEMVPNVK
jgi:hypothetical protein